METITELAAHAPLAPSSLEAIELCPEFEFKDSEPGDTSQGTLVHEAVEAGDPELVESDDEAYFMYSMCNKRLQDVQSKCQEVHQELRVHSHRRDCWGTVDLVGIDGGLAYVWDWKTGRIPVSNAKTNPQGMVYVLGVFLRFPDVMEVQMNFLMARTGQVTFHTFKRTDIPNMMIRIDRIAARRNDSTAVMNVTYNCRNCAALTHCDAVRKQVVPQAPKDSVEMAGVSNTENIKTPEDAARAMECKEILAKWFEGWSEQASARCLEIADQVDIPGYEITTRKGRDKVVDMGTFDDALAKIGVKSFLRFPELLSLSLTKFKNAVVKEWLVEEFDSTRTKPAIERKKEHMKTFDTLWEEGVIETAPESRYLKKTIKHKLTN